VILTDREIRIALGRGLIQIDPAPDEKAAFSSTAVDLTLDSTLSMFKQHAGYRTHRSKPGIGSRYPAGDHETAQNPEGRVPPSAEDSRFGLDQEYVERNVETRIAARVEGKSSLARFGLGVHVTAPTIHAGFAGQIQLEMVNHGAVPIRLRAGMRICQLIFETTLGTPERGYRGQFAGQMAKAPKKKAA